MAKTVSELGRVDACVANAGVSVPAGFLEITPDEWRRIVGVNLDGAFYTLQAAARQLVEQGDGGALVALASTAAVHGAGVNAHYAASKAGVLGLVRSAAVALARYGIRVNALLPGWTVTDLARGGYQDDRFREATTARTPVRRWADPTSSPRWRHTCATSRWRSTPATPSPSTAGTRSSDLSGQRPQQPGKSRAGIC